jgi:DNA-binding beta-propeller fold protein YncE
MQRNRRRLGLAFSLAAAASLLVMSCSEDPAGPGPDPGPDPDPTPTSGTIETFAGAGVNGLGPDGQDPLVTAFSLPQDLTFGPDGLPYILDWNNHRVRTIRNNVVETVIGTGELGDAPEGIATQTKLNHPTNIAFDNQGKMLLAAWHNSKIMQWDMTTGWLSRFAGDGSRAFGGDGGPAISCKLDLPVGVAIDPTTNDIYVCDEANVRIRKINGSDGVINTICGDGTRGYSGDGGPATSAQLFLPGGQSAPPVGRVAYYNGSLYIADTNNSCIRRIDLSTGIIYTFAGTGSYGYSGDGGLATAAQLFFPADVEVDADGNVFIADTYNMVIRKVDTAGTITTFAGTYWQFTGDGSVHYAGDGGPAAQAVFDRPYGIAFDADGNLYIADTHNNRVRKIWK